MSLKVSNEIILNYGKRFFTLAMCTSWMELLMNVSYGDEVDSNMLAQISFSNLFRWCSERENGVNILTIVFGSQKHDNNHQHW